MLRTQGISAVMLSGDAIRVAKTIGAEIGIDDVRGALKPDQKVAALEAFRTEGRHTAMVGDGINDAPALAAADVGIAMGSGSDAAMESASITLMRPDPRLVAGAMQIARATWLRVRWNLFWAFYLQCHQIAAGGAGLSVTRDCRCGDGVKLGHGGQQLTDAARLAATRMGRKRMNVRDAGKRSGLPSKTIRYYDEIGLVVPDRRENGYRDYDSRAVQKLAFLKRARQLGFSIEDCRTQLLSLYEDKSPRQRRCEVTCREASDGNRYASGRVATA